MKIMTGLFRAIRKSLNTKDNDLGQFREKIMALVSGKDQASEEEISSQVEELKAMTNDLPDGDEKSELQRYLEDFKALKEQETPVAEKAASVVADLFERLDTEAMKNAPAEPEEPAPESGAQEPDPAPAEAEGEGDQDSGETKDDDPGSKYTLEEIYQFIKKRMSEDSGEECGKEETSDGDGEEEKTEPDQTTDNAPRVNVTINDHATEGGLVDLFRKAKNGGF